MAIEQISTGYKPEFALGALYHGFNAGNADNASRLANLQAEWELQKSQAEDPYKVMEAILAGNRANAMNTPDMLDWHTRGYKGQMQSQDASGRMAHALYGDRLANESADLQNKTIQSQIDRGYNEEVADRLGTIRNGEYPDSATIGFNMQPPVPQQQTGTIGFPQQPNLVNQIASLESGGKDFNPDASPMRSSKGAMFKMQVMPATAKDPGFGIKPAANDTPAEYNRVGVEYAAALEKKYGGDRAKILAAYNAGPEAVDKLLSTYGDAWQEHLPAETKTYLQKAGVSGVFASHVKQPQINPWLAGVDMQDSRWNALQGLRMDTPKFRQEMAKGEQKTDAQLEAAEMRNRAIVQAAEAKDTIKDPKYKEILAKNMDIVDTVTVQHNAGKPVSEADQLAYYKAARFIQQHERMLQISNPAAFQPRLDMAAISGMPMTSTPTQQAVASFPTINFGKPGVQPTPQTPATVDGRPVTKLQ